MCHATASDRDSNGIRHLHWSSARHPQTQGRALFRIARRTAWTLLVVAFSLPIAFCRGEAQLRAYVTVDGLDPSQPGSVTVIDVETSLAISSIAVGRQPQGIAATPSGRTLYVANAGDGTISVIRTATGVAAETPIRVGRGPLGVSTSPDGSRVYVANGTDDTLSIIDTASDNVVGAPIPVGRAPVRVAVSTDGARAYVANQLDGTVSVVDTASGAVATTIPVGGSPMDVVVSDGGDVVYVVDNDSNSVTLINTATNRPVGLRIGVGDSPVRLALSPGGDRVYVANTGDGTVSLIDTATNRVAGLPIPIGSEILSGPSGIAVSADDTRVGVVASVEGNAVLFDPTTPENPLIIPVGPNPSDVVFATPPSGPCIGDCNNDGRVTVDEIVLGTVIAMGRTTLDQCPIFDRSGDQRVTVDELVMAVNVALSGCQ